MADLSITAANVAKVSGNVRHGTAGATITAGQAVYLDSATGTWKLAVVDGTGSPTTNTAGANGLGIALHGAASGQPITVQYDGVINPGGTVTVGVIYCCSPAAAGGIAPSADVSSVDNDYVSILGVGITASQIKLGILASGVVA